MYIQNISAKNYQKNKEILQKRTCGNYKNLSEAEKYKKRHYAQYRTFFIENELSEEKKTKASIQKSF